MTVEINSVYDHSQGLTLPERLKLINAEVRALRSELEATTIQRNAAVQRGDDAAFRVLQDAIFRQFYHLEHKQRIQRKLRAAVAKEKAVA